MAAATVARVIKSSPAGCSIGSGPAGQCSSWPGSGQLSFIISISFFTVAADLRLAAQGYPNSTSCRINKVPLFPLVPLTFRFSHLTFLSPFVPLTFRSSRQTEVISVDFKTKFPTDLNIQRSQKSHLSIQTNRRSASLWVQLYH